MLAVDSAKMFRIRSKMWNMGIQFGNISFATPCVVPHSLVQMQLRLYMSESERAHWAHWCGRTHEREQSRTNWILSSRKSCFASDDNENQYVLKLCGLAIQTVTVDAEREYNLYIIKNKIAYIICEYNFGSAHTYDYTPLHGGSKRERHDTHTLIQPLACCVSVFCQKKSVCHRTHTHTHAADTQAHDKCISCFATPPPILVGIDYDK